MVARGRNERPDVAVTCTRRTSRQVHVDLCDDLDRVVDDARENAVERACVLLQIRVSIDLARTHTRTHGLDSKCAAQHSAQRNKRGKRKQIPTSSSDRAPF